MNFICITVYAYYICAYYVYTFEVLICACMYACRSLLSGVLTVDRVTKELKRLGGGRVELWQGLIGHLLTICQAHSSPAGQDKLTK